MNEVGIFARTFTQPTLERILDAVVAHGLSQVHFNMKAACDVNLPDVIAPELCTRVRNAFAERGLVMTSVSATFNAIHPDPRQRELDTRRACHLMDSCRAMGTSMLSLCTGTLDSSDMWKRHPDNDRPDAWRDLLTTFEQLLPVAERNGLTLGIEPERNNVVNSAEKARRLLNELRSPHLKIILDGANLFDEGQISDMREVLTRAFELLSEDMVMAHAKDIPDPEVKSQAAGRGLLDWPIYFELFRIHKFEGPVILHNLREAEVPAALSFVKEGLRAVS
jgi:sugar phosphate isomerase/epimerase